MPAMLLALLHAAAATCVDDADCSHNGRCVNRSCVCSPGWRGGNCHVLQFVPTTRPAAQAYCHFNDSTWGGTVLFEKGVYQAVAPAAYARMHAGTGDALVR